MRIAWRYNSLPSIDTSHKSLTYFDSSKRIDREMLTKADIESFKGNDKTFENPSLGSCFHNAVYGRILAKLNGKLDSAAFSTDEANVPSDTERNVLRISISALGSPLWYDDAFLEDVCLFLYFLKALVRTSLAVACITVPSHLFKHLVTEILSDGLVRLIRTSSLLFLGRHVDSSRSGLG